MSYSYEFDETRLGDYEFSPDSYRLMMKGLQELLLRIKDWNRRATELGATEEPYAREAGNLGRRISWGQTELRRNPMFVRVNGMSIGSMRYLRAGLEFMILTRAAELRRKRVEGWPSGALSSVEKSVEELQKLAESLKVEPAAILWEVLAPEESGVIVQQIRNEDADFEWDAFISHASEDKQRFVRRLADALTRAGLRIWYDDFSLRVGDSLRRSIDRGLSRSRYGIVVLSPSFFAKEWPQKELDALVGREHDGVKVILPVWHDITAVAVREKSPLLADRVAADSQKGLEDVVAKILEVLQPEPGSGRKSGDDT